MIIAGLRATAATALRRQGRLASAIDGREAEVATESDPVLNFRTGQVERVVRANLIVSCSGPGDRTNLASRYGRSCWQLPAI
jgi:hypothetical protein